VIAQFGSWEGSSDGVTINPIGPAALMSSLSPTSALKSTSQSGSGSGFGSVLAQAVSSTNQLLNQTNQMAAGYAAGANVPIDQLMMAEQQASLAVDLTVQVRDRMVSAYQSIMNMQI
jgi:flagellar hook-basal body complex protein FliE